MHDSIPFVLALIIILGISAQWLAWRLGLPSILLLLMFGILGGPVTGWLKPDEIFGDLLQPCVAFAVALILFEGGLTLKLSEVPKLGTVVPRLVTVGVVATWVVGAAAAYLIFNLDVAMSALLGAILSVTGPTVIGPLLRTIRPTGNVGPILRWEGIVIDPVGALLTVLTFEVITVILIGGDVSDAGWLASKGVLVTILLGSGLGLAAAALLVFMLYRHWIADYLENAVALMLVFAIFAVSNHFQHESGLLAVTVMGFALANQKFVDVEHIVEFKENLRVLLISSLFIVLAARLEMNQLTEQLLPGLLFVAVLILIARPLSVWLSTVGSGLPKPQRVFLASMAPRGIVAAAISSIFALRLEHEGFAEADLLVPITFITIIATVAVYGLCSPLVARKLGVAESDPQGVLFVGAHAWVRGLAALLQREGFRVFVVDSNRDHIAEARMAGLSAQHGNILGEHAVERISLGGLGRVLAVTPNEWINVLAVHRFERIFGRAECYQLPTKKKEHEKKGHTYLHARWLFDEKMTYANLARLHAEGFKPKATPITEAFNYEAFCQQYEDEAVPLFIKQDNRLTVITSKEAQRPQPGQTLISLVRSAEAEDHHKS